MLMSFCRRHVISRSPSYQLNIRKNYSSLVSTSWLSEKKNENIRILACVDPVTYHNGHIEKAIHFPLALTGFKDPKSNGILGEKEFQMLVLPLLLETLPTVIFYDNQWSLLSTRAWWVFYHYGYPKDKLKVLDGGWKQWVADSKDISITSESAVKNAQVNDIETFSINVDSKKALVDYDYIQTVSKNSNSGVRFIDARSESEYAAGRVPHAIHFEWIKAMNIAQNGKFLSKEELIKMLQQSYKITPNDHIISYCAKGIRGAHIAFVMQEILGFKDVKVYENSMAEYLNEPHSKIET